MPEDEVTELTGLDVVRVGLVDTPATDRRFAVIKRAEETEQESDMGDDKIETSEPDFSALEKRFSDELKKRDEAHTADLAKRDTEIADLRKSLGNAESKARLTELVAKARTEFGSLGDPLELAKNMAIVEAASPEAFEALCKSLAAAEGKAAAGAQLLKATTGRSAAAVEGSAQDQITKRAEAMVASGQEPNIYKAWDRITREDPALIRELRAEEN